MRSCGSKLSNFWMSHKSQSSARTLSCKFQFYCITKLMISFHHSLLIISIEDQHFLYPKIIQVPACLVLYQNWWRHILFYKERISFSPDGIQRVVFFAGADEFPESKFPFLFNFVFGSSGFAIDWYFKTLRCEPFLCGSRLLIFFSHRHVISISSISEPQSAISWHVNFYEPAKGFQSVTCNWEFAKWV